MKLCIKALVLGVLGVLTIQAGPVTEITGGTMYRSYSGLVTEFDGLDLTGPDFRMILGIMADSVPFYTSTPFTDHVSATVMYLPGWPNCPSCSPIFGTVDLDVTTYLSLPLGPYPGPDRSTGIFSATGTFTAPGVNIPLTGGGTTLVNLRPLFDPDPGYTYYAPGLISYTFAPAPEPALAIPTGLGLLALILARRASARIKC